MIDEEPKFWDHPQAWAIVITACLLYPFYWLYLKWTGNSPFVKSWFKKNKNKH